MQTESSGFHLPPANIYTVCRSKFSAHTSFRARDLARDTAAPDMH